MPETEEPQTDYKLSEEDRAEQRAKALAAAEARSKDFKQ
jgi:hypothetical protein